MVVKNEKLHLIILLLLFVLAVAGGFYMISKFRKEESPAQQLHVYSKEIDCYVTDIQKGLFTTKVSVYNTDYRLAKSFCLYGSDAAKFKDVKKWDVVSCYLYTWSDGDEVIERIMLMYQIF